MNNDQQRSKNDISRKTSILHYALQKQSPSTSNSNSTSNSINNVNINPEMMNMFPDNVIDATPRVDSLACVYNNTRMKFLDKFYGITTSAKNRAQNILSHPLAQPILPHLPHPVQSFTIANGEKKPPNREYDSASVYLAKWARKVAEEGQNSKIKEGHQQSFHSNLGIFEIINSDSPSHTRSPDNSINMSEFKSFFNSNSKPMISESLFRREVFNRSLDNVLRKECWPYLLNVIEWKTTYKERCKIWKDLDNKYQDLKSIWKKDEIFNDINVIEERRKIKVDCLRTDRQHPFFANKRSEDDYENEDGNVINDEDEGTSQPSSNIHIKKLQNVLLTWNFYDSSLGYVQGMSDLCAPFYVISEGDECWTFWCFVKVMERLKENFVRDQSGMSRKLITLQELIEVMDPELFNHFKKSDNLNMFFCFRLVDL